MLYNIINDIGLKSNVYNYYKHLILDQYLILLTYIYNQFSITIYMNVLVFFFCRELFVGLSCKRGETCF